MIELIEGIPTTGGPYSIQASAHEMINMWINILSYHNVMVVRIPLDDSKKVEMLRVIDPDIYACPATSAANHHYTWNTIGEAMQASPKSSLGTLENFDSDLNFHQFTYRVLETSAEQTQFFINYLTS